MEKSLTLPQISTIFRSLGEELHSYHNICLDIQAHLSDSLDETFLKIKENNADHTSHLSQFHVMSIQQIDYLTQSTESLSIALAKLSIQLNIENHNNSDLWETLINAIQLQSLKERLTAHPTINKSSQNCHFMAANLKILKQLKYQIST